MTYLFDLIDWVMFPGRTLCKVIGILGVSTCYNWCLALWEGTGLKLSCFFFFFFSNNWAWRWSLVANFNIDEICDSSWFQKGKRRQKVTPSKSVSHSEASDTSAKVCSFISIRSFRFIFLFGFNCYKLYSWVCPNSV